MDPVTGFLPMFLVISGLMCAHTYLSMPKDPADNSKILQIWLQARASQPLDQGLEFRISRPSTLIP